MRRQRNTKIISTLGPGTSTKAGIEQLFDAGTDVFRLNFSHGTHADHAERFAAIRSVEQIRGTPIGIMADLQGPKIRVGEFEDGSVNLEKGQLLRLDCDAALGNQTRIPVPHPDVIRALSAGDDILLDDGKIRLEVEKSQADHLSARVVVGGVLSDHKGLNIPGVSLPMSALTAKDRRDLQFALEHGADWIALSFVQRPDDVAEARKLVAGRAGVLAKLEKPVAIDHLEGILELADAVMVARGDLGVEAPPEDVPGLQKLIISTARSLGKPVVVATQMLESMISAPTPTRAEASDVATAVYDGADAVMLSAETAVGEYPIEAVSIMDRIIARTEGDPHYRKLAETERRAPEATSSDAITAAARQVARTISAAAIVTYTTTGSTALRAARERPVVPILGLTPSRATARRLALVWGVQTVIAPDIDDFDDMVTSAAGVAKQEGLAEKGERLVVTAGVPFGTPGATNVLRIAWVD